MTCDKNNYTLFNWNQAHDMCRSFKESKLALRDNWDMTTTNSFIKFITDVNKKDKNIYNIGIKGFYFSLSSNGSDRGDLVSGTDASTRVVKDDSISYSSCESTH